MEGPRLGYVRERRTPGGPPGHARREGASQVAMEERHHPRQDPALGHDPAGQRRAAHKPTTKKTNRCRPPLRPEEYLRSTRTRHDTGLIRHPGSEPRAQPGRQDAIGSTTRADAAPTTRNRPSSHNEEEQAPYVEDVGSDDSGRKDQEPYDETEDAYSRDSREDDDGPQEGVIHYVYTGDYGAR
ncbi:hypothetical protein M5D96_014003 [Drosophila gunungcola]|uniref:Uncharacterized protein n=1 Tax=Drosophila gunungcola TaxID=103775 RepID=A0A9P9YA82_9MUSC|nr:hypothetical protein M5D96_014000 [Drosophila gunungcola]KAI8033244.1 hypothetical protein M5D96_014003 [Drosophila gunungcola]